MTHFLLTAWHVDALFAIGYALAVACYVARARPHAPARALAFAAGLTVLALVVTSPLDALAGRYLLSAHMAQHLLLTQIVPPLLLLGLPATLVERCLQRPVLAAAERVLRLPAVAWLAGIGALWLWHAPAIYDAASASHTGMHIQHLAVLAAGLAFWWPVFAPLARARLSALAAVLYLASACLASSVLGVTITFASGIVYPIYLHPVDSYAILPALRSAGLTPQVDQQIGGLVMWAPCCLLYVGAIMIVLARWFGELDPAPLEHGAATAG